MTTEARMVFGEVLAELMEEREIPATEERMGRLADVAGLDPDRLIARVAGKRTGHVDYLEGLARVLDLSEPEDKAGAGVHVRAAER
jgi:hypothetical protein